MAFWNKKKVEPQPPKKNERWLNPDAEKNELWLKICDEVMNEMAHSLITINWNKSRLITKKGRAKAAAQCEIESKAFATMVFARWPWVNSYTLHQAAMRNNTVEYFVCVTGIDYENISSLLLVNL